MIILACSDYDSIQHLLVSLSTVTPDLLLYSYRVTVVLFFWREYTEGRRRERISVLSPLLCSDTAGMCSLGQSCSELLYDFAVLMEVTPCAYAGANTPHHHHHPPIVHLNSTLSSASPLLSSVQQLSPLSTTGKEVLSLTLTHSLNM